MSYKLSIFEGTWWANIKNVLLASDVNTSLTEEIVTYGGRNLSGTEFIEFDTEEQLTLFLLKWS
jgi:hypothetical protein